MIKFTFHNTGFIIILVLLLLFSVGCNNKKKEEKKDMLEKKHTINTDSPQKTVKLVFIHHSVGGNWLAHEYGGLANELNKNNYYVNDITYGWEPPQLTDTLFKKIKRKIYGWFGWDDEGAYSIGSRTDIGHWYEWFAGPDSKLIMEAVYKENGETDRFGDHSNKSSNNPLENSGENIENEIVMIKSCYPNTMLSGNPSDPSATGDNPSRRFKADSKEHTVANAKRIYNDILKHFEKRQDKFFVIITSPPRMDLPEKGRIARGFSNWLYYHWLKENNYKHNNVFVFDLYNVLTSGKDWKKNDAEEEKGNHHRIWKGREQHVFDQGIDTLIYPRDGNNNHPSPAGLQKAKTEFVDVLNYRYNQWKQGKSE